MNRLIQTVSAVLLAGIPLAAGIPVQNMNSSTLGIEYSGFVSGQFLEEDEVESSIVSHMFRLQYSPAPLVRFSLGVGSSRLGLENVNTDFSGNPGISVMAGAAFHIPKVHELVSLTGGVESYYLSSAGGEMRSVALLHTPFAGLIVHLGRYTDLELGGEYLILDKQIKISDATTSYRNPGDVRFYGSLTLHDPLSGVYLSGGVSASESLSDAWKESGPYESSVWFQFGIILKQDREFERTEQEIRRYFPNYEKLKEKQEKMAEEIAY